MDLTATVCWKCLEYGLSSAVFSAQMRYDVSLSKIIGLLLRYKLSEIAVWILWIHFCIWNMLVIIMNISSLEVAWIKPRTTTWFKWMITDWHIIDCHHSTSAWLTRNKGKYTAHFFLVLWIWANPTHLAVVFTGFFDYCHSAARSTLIDSTNWSVRKHLSLQ